MLNLKQKTIVMGALLALGTGAAVAADQETQAQLDALKAAIPKFAIPMREVGDRFQNMYFAANKGNWALAAYMSKYMNGAMNPAALTKAAEYKVWKGFYENNFAEVNRAIQAKDLNGFNKSYAAVVTDCNDCHKAMEYGFINVVKQTAPSDQGINYTLKSEPGDVPK